MKNRRRPLIARDDIEARFDHIETAGADLGRPDIAALMDSDGNGLGEMWIGAPGWASANVNEVKTRDYGLLDFVEPVRKYVFREARLALIEIAAEQIYGQRADDELKDRDAPAHELVMVASAARENSLREDVASSEPFLVVRRLRKDTFPAAYLK